MGLSLALSLASMDESVHHLEALKYLPFADKEAYTPQRPATVNSVMIMRNFLCSCSPMKLTGCRV